MKREVPEVIYQLEALMRRLDSRNQKLPGIDKQINKYWSGYRGEQNLDYYLDFLPSSKFTCLKTARLKNRLNKTFQLDNLITTSKFAVLAEVKNNSGTLTFEPSSAQYFQVINGNRLAISDPFEQVRRQKIEFERWMEDRGIIGYPVLPFVVIGNQSTILQFPPGSEAAQHMLFPEQLPKRLETLEKNYQSSNARDFRKQLGKLHKAIHKEKLPERKDVLNSFKISSSEIQLGVRCPSCNSYSMLRESGKWVCPHCQHVSRHAHQLAIMDYFLIYKPEITNRECREFLGIECRFLARKLLLSMRCETKGTGKSTVYLMPPVTEFFNNLKR
ncbi:NERD domain-containing protein [Bacillaceae bacterium S4-13-58]